MHRNLLIKSASGNCNMHCAYCFYADEMANREVPSYGFMSKETAHTLIDKVLSSSSTCSFGFQGGEPTLSTLPFFKDFVSYAEKVGKGRFSLALQTNGFNIDNSWASFFHENHFLVGLSLDGNRAIHDHYRKGKDGSGSFNRVLETSRLFKEEGVEFNILTTVTKDVALNIDLINSYYKRKGFKHIQYIPCLDRIGDERGESSYSLTPSLFATFLCKTFDFYYQAWLDGEYVSIRYFDNLVHMLLRRVPEECGMSGICGLNYVIEADGSVYPCDFYVLDEYKIGNINEDSFLKIDKNREKIGFVEKSKEVSEECKSCRFFPICRGGCRRNRDTFTSSPLMLNYFCSSYKEFFSYAIERLEYMASMEAKV